MGRARGGIQPAQRPAEPARRGPLVGALRRAGVEDPGSALLGLDELYALVAVCQQWDAPFAAVCVRLVDALWHGDDADFARQARDLQRELEHEGLGHDARRVAAGLAVMRATKVVAWVHGVSSREVRMRLKEQASLAKGRHTFPWHLFDG
jgi:hypothetical protein